MLIQIIICRLTLSSPCKIFLWLSHHQADIMVYILSQHKAFLDEFCTIKNLLSYSNDHRINPGYNYIIFTCLIYFYIISHNFIENNDIINLHTLLLTKYEMIIQRRYILIPPKITKILHFIIIYAWYCLIVLV